MDGWMDGWGEKEDVDVNVKEEEGHASRARQARGEFVRGQGGGTLTAPKPPAVPNALELDGLALAPKDLNVTGTVLDASVGVLLALVATPPFVNVRMWLG